MEQKIHNLITTITEAFKGVQLGEGVSWHEANVLDLYGTEEERKIARAKDEKNDWTKIPFSLIGDLKFQDIMPFLDAEGLRFYLPPCMIYTLQNYKTSSSLIIHSIIYKLTNGETAIDLQKIISPQQKDCIVQFLQICIEIGSDYFDLYKVEQRLEKYWLNELHK